MSVIAMDSSGLASGWTTFHTTCAGQQGQQGQQGGASAASLIIHAVPSLVRQGDTTKISWNATGVAKDSCTVTSPTDPLANGTGNWASPLSIGVVTSSIQRQTVYTLQCTGTDDSILTQSVTVNILPTFKEL